MNDELRNETDTNLQILTPPRRLKRSTRLILQIIFLLLGVGILVPWNAFINAKEYFLSRKCQHEGDAVDANIESTFAMVYNLSSVISLGLIIFVQWLGDQWIAEKEEHKTGGRHPSMQDALHVSNETESSKSATGHSFWLVMVPLTFYLAVFTMQTVMVLMMEIRASLFWALTIVSLVVCGICSAIATAGTVATAGLFESEVAMNPFLTGQAVGGVAVSAANFAAAVMEDSSIYWNAHCQNDDSARKLEETCVPYQQRDFAVFSYFFLGSVVLVACLLGYAYIDRFQRRRHRDDYETLDSMESSVVEDSPRIGLEMPEERMRQQQEEEVIDGLMPPSFAGNDTKDDLAATVDPAETASSTSSEPNVDTNNETAAVWTIVRGPAICIFLTFFVTLSLFPGWTSGLRSVRQCQTHKRLANDLYTPFSFVLFNTGDMLGRILSAKVPTKRIHHLSRKLVLASLLRFIFFPLLFLCIGGAQNRVQIPSDLYSLIVQFFFAVTNGLLVTLAFIHAPSLLPNVTHVQERSSELLTFALAFGLLSGSLFSFPVSKMAR